jgi:hypothetical protein
MAKKAQIFFISVVVLSAAAVYFITRRSNKPKSQIKKFVLIGGLDNRKGDLSISQQKELVLNGFSNKVEITAFRYNDPKSALNYIKENPDVKVILFSAGCSQSLKVATILKDAGKNLSNLYILEPYHSGGTTSKAVQSAVNLGVPSKNVLVGSYKATGKGIVENARSTPKCKPNHWCSLTEIAKIINAE